MRIAVIACTLLLALTFQPAAKVGSADPENPGDAEARCNVETAVIHISYRDACDIYCELTNVSRWLNSPQYALGECSDN